MSILSEPYTALTMGEQTCLTAVRELYLRSVAAAPEITYQTAS
jgi:hypothetical protein